MCSTLASALRKELIVHVGIQSSVLNACNKLVTLMRDQPDLKQHLINNATIIQTVNLLEACEQKRDVLLAVLQLVNEVPLRSACE